MRTSRHGKLYVESAGEERNRMEEDKSKFRRLKVYTVPAVGAAEALKPYLEEKSADESSALTHISLLSRLFFSRY
jgi:hypothetical protein